MTSTPVQLARGACAARNALSELVSQKGSSSRSEAAGARHAGALEPWTRHKWEAIKLGDRCVRVTFDIGPISRWHGERWVDLDVDGPLEKIPNRWRRMRYR